jgi:hypothetical protein
MPGVIREDLPLGVHSRSESMAKRNLKARMIRFAMAVAVGGSAFQLSGCDPVVRNAVLTGLETTTTTLTGTLISAFFLSLQDDDTTGGGLTTT